MLFATGVLLRRCISITNMVAKSRKGRWWPRSTLVPVAREKNWESKAKEKCDII